jgi:hypothetical protein
VKTSRERTSPFEFNSRYISLRLLSTPVCPTLLSPIPTQGTKQERKKGSIEKRKIEITTRTIKRKAYVIWLFETRKKYNPNLLKI